MSPSRSRTAFLAVLSLGLMALTCGTARAQFAFSSIAKTGDAAPTGTFDVFFAPSVDNGTVAFRGDYNGSGSGIFTSAGGALTTVVKKGDAAPSGTFEILLSPVQSGGVTVFEGNYNSSSGNGIFKGNGGALTSIAKTGDASPIGILGGAAIASQNGGVATFFGSAGSTSAILTGSGGSLTKIVKTGDAAPVGTFSGLFGSTSSQSGSITAFVADYDNNSQSGVFTGSGSTLTTIVKTGDVAPIGTFSRLISSSQNGNTTAFSGLYGEGGVGGNVGLFTRAGGITTTIATTNDAAPIGMFYSFRNISLQGDSVAFFGEYNGGNDSGLFIGNAGSVTSVIQKGSPLFGSTVASLDPQFGFDGTNISFAYTLENGISGVALTSIAIPEPGVLSLVVLGAACLWRTRRARTPAS